MFRLERWTAGTLLGTWAAYWAALLGVTIGPGLLAAWRLTRGSGPHGTIVASIDGSEVLLKVNESVSATGAWSFSTSIAAALAWIALPPLALWLVWLISRPRRDAVPVADRAALPPDREPVFPAPSLTSPEFPERAPIEQERK